MSINHQLNVNPKDMRGIGIHLSRLESGRQMSVIDTFLKKNKNSATMKECSESTDGGPAISQPMERENDNVKCQQNKVTSAENVKTNSIMNFFTVKKSLSQSSTSKTKSHSELLCPENFDKDVFMSLPKDIQNELVKEFNLKDVPEITEKSVTDPVNREECNKGTNIGNDNRKETDFTERSNVHQDLLCSQTIDKDVIAALPDDIKKEVMREYGLREIPESVAGSSKTKQEYHENLSLSQVGNNLYSYICIHIHTRSINIYSQNIIICSRKFYNFNLDKMKQILKIILLLFRIIYFSNKRQTIHL